MVQKKTTAQGQVHSSTTPASFLSILGVVKAIKGDSHIFNCKIWWRIKWHCSASHSESFDNLFIFLLEIFEKVEKGKNKGQKKEREGRKLSINQNAISVGLRLAALRFLARLIAFHYKFPPQPIRDKSVAVQPAGPLTHTLWSALCSLTHV